jgi:hypothetical protein
MQAQNAEAIFLQGLSLPSHRRSPCSVHWPWFIWRTLAQFQVWWPKTSILPNDPFVAKSRSCTWNNISMQMYCRLIFYSPCHGASTLRVKGTESGRSESKCNPKRLLQSKSDPKGPVQSGSGPKRTLLFSWCPPSSSSSNPLFEHPPFTPSNGSVLRWYRERVRRSPSLYN